LTLQRGDAYKRPAEALRVDIDDLVE